MEIRSIVESYGDSKAVGSYYLEFWRRVEVLSLVDKYCSRGSLVIDLGAQPFILSCALVKMGYRVIAVDIEPESYAKIAKTAE